MTEEIWKPIPGWTGYEVSDHGKVRSLVGGKPRLLKIQLQPTGHYRTHLTANKKTKGLFVHRLVLEAFVGPCPHGKTDCAHLDGNPANNHVSNLMWATRQENMQHRIDHGRNTVGKDIKVKMNAERVIEMRMAYKGGANLKELAAQFGISTTQARGIVRGVWWRSVDMCGLPMSPRYIQTKHSRTDQHYQAEIQRLREDIARLHAENDQLRKALP